MENVHKLRTDWTIPCSNFLVTGYNNVVANGSDQEHCSSQAFHLGNFRIGGGHEPNH